MVHMDFRLPPPPRFRTGPFVPPSSAAAGIPVDQMMTFVGHRDIRTAMRHYRDPDATSTQAIAARPARARSAAANTSR